MVTWTALAAIATWLVLMVRQVPCRQTVAGHPVNTFYRLCYSDIPVLYQTRGLGLGQIPGLSFGWEYPPLVSLFAEIARRLTDLFGTTSGPGLTDQQVLDNANIFFTVNAVLLFGCFLGLVAAHFRLAPGWQATAIALSPVVMAAGLISWDLLAVSLTSAALLLWARGCPAWAGVVFALAISSAAYPLLIVGALLVLCLRARDGRAAAALTVGTTAVWAAINLPLALTVPDTWLVYWRTLFSHQDDLGSVWYVLKLASLPVPHSQVVAGVIVAALLIGVGVLIVRAPAAPRVGQVAFLVVAVPLALGTVYSPQYVLWLYPLLVLARPRWQEVTAFSIAELAYFAAIWGHLAGTLHPASGGADRIYWAAVLLRIGVTVWIAVRVVDDILAPGDDRVRGAGCDPLAGPLGQAWAGDSPAAPVSAEDGVDGARQAGARGASMASTGLPHQAGGAGMDVAVGGEGLGVPVSGLVQGPAGPVRPERGPEDILGEGAGRDEEPGGHVV